MINFKKLRWKNFLSTGNTFTQINLAKSKTTLIVGENGAGKSTILDAISFALYGKPFRKINKPQLLNSINGKNLLVEVEFDIGNHKYKIVRGMKPTVFEVFQNGNLVNQNAESKEYQEHLEKYILKLNHKSFSQVVILGSASFTPFMQLSASNRREVIEDLLDIQIFSTMNTLLKGKIQKNKDELATADMEVRLTEQKIQLYKQNMDILKQNNEDLINEHKEKIELAQDQIVKYTALCDEIEQDVNKLYEEVADESKISVKLKKLDMLSAQMTDKMKRFKSEVGFYHDNDNCPTCKQDLQVDFKQHKVDAYQQSIKELDDGMIKLDEERRKVLERMEEIEAINAKIKKKNELRNEYSYQIRMAHNTIASHTTSIQTIESQTSRINSDDKELESLSLQLNANIDKKNSIVEQKSLFDIAASLLKDTGIKTKIIKQYIPIFNKLINKYLASMDFFVNFELNENFEEKIKSRFRDEFSYESFSEGEKLRIDLALLFTWRAISKLRNSASTNLLIMDEIFDSSLDNSGTEEFLKILQSLASDTNVFIISHKGDALFDKFHSVIKFEKHKNFSRIAA